jgi:hypothetical protein
VWAHPAGSIVEELISRPASATVDQVDSVR